MSSCVISRRRCGGGGGDDESAVGDLARVTRLWWCCGGDASIGYKRRVYANSAYCNVCAANALSTVATMDGNILRVLFFVGSMTCATDDCCAFIVVHVAAGATVDEFRARPIWYQPYCNLYSSGSVACR